MSDFSAKDLERANRIGRPVGRFLARWRELIRRRPWLNLVYKALVSVAGGAIVIIGLILVPLPGPGWLVVFVGLTVLGAEYKWARRFTSWLRMTLARFWAWWRARRGQRAAKKAHTPAAFVNDRSGTAPVTIVRASECESRQPVLQSH